MGMKVTQKGSSRGSRVRKKVRILVLHGPNLNLLGEREPEIYGHLTLAQLNGKIRQSAVRLGVILRIFQSNSEGELIDCLHQNRRWAQGVIFNPAAYTHYSFALRDAVAAIRCPTVEVHLSDLKIRAQTEGFRGLSVIAPVCVGQISGKGVDSYLEALQFLLQREMASGE
jgi:3-dehydroquinate dehydratase-2